MTDQANIIILRNVDGGRESVKTGYAEIELQNGLPVAYGKMSDERLTRGAYELKAATAEDTKLGFIYNADVPVVTTITGNTYNIGSDPREITFKKGTILNFNLFKVGQEIAVTQIGGTADDATHVIIDPGKTAWVYAKEEDIADVKVALEIIGNGYISVGSDRVPCVELLCVKA